MKKNIFLLLILIIVLSVLAYFAYPTLKNRYFPNTKTQPQDTSQELYPMDSKPTDAVSDDQMSSGPNANTTDLSDAEKDFLSGKKTETTEPKSTINANERNASGKTLAHITITHCNSECNAFAMDLKLLEYCQQVCGISPIKEVSGCDGKSNLEKDYCLKDLAVSKKDASICKQIADANIELTCKNRITQDILEGN